MRMSWPIVAVLCALLLAGCSGVPVATRVETSPVSGVSLKGIVHGGQQPIVGAHVYLYAANTGGYLGASTSLLLSESGPTGTSKDGNGNYYVTSGSGGVFSISNYYTCPGANTQVYLYAIGGDPTPGVPNAAAGLMAALGSCDSPNFSNLSIVVNEVSTVATAYAIAGFATDATHVSSSGSTQALSGIANAFGATLDSKGNALGTVANLESISTGAALATTPSGNGTVPQTLINTLANILAACINTNGSTASGMPCGTLFSNAMNGTSTPSDTATAAINIAHNPGANVDNLYNLPTPSAPFQPALTGAPNEPNDFTISISYTGGGLDGSGDAPEGIAVDSLGNVWVPNHTSGTLSELNDVGLVAASGPSGFGLGSLSSPTSVAIDPSGLVSVANFDGDSLTQFYASGAVKTKPQGSGLYQPYGIAVDSVDNIWVANSGDNTLSEFQSSGAPSSGSGGFAGVPAPAGIAAGTSGVVWTTVWASLPYQIVEVVPSTIPGDPPTFTFLSEEQLASPYGIAVDASGNVWVTNSGGNGSLSEYSPSQGKWLSPDPNGFTNGGIDDPYGVAIDGAGNVWTANYGGNSNSISEFNSSGTAISGANGYVSNGLLFPYGIAIDPSGNVWVASDNTAGPLTEFVGAAAPVVTPLAAGAAYGELGTRP